MQSIKLHKGRELSVLRRHPWIFSRAIQSGIDTIADGECLLVQDYKGKTIGTGHFQNSSLAVRLIAFEAVAVDEAFWRKRLQEALDYRVSLGSIQAGHTDAFRLVHGEGDQLPGLIIDIYANVAVIQAHSIGMYLAMDDIAQALVSIPGLTIDHIYSKSKEALPADFGQTVTDGWRIGSGLNEILIHEGGIPILVNVETGQKTGFFLDQRHNRELIQRYAAGKEVLNCFCYTGGFSLYALRGNATRVVSVDTSAPALQLLEQNLGLAQYHGVHETIRENVMPFLTRGEDLYDIVILDPPAFAKNLSKRHNAIQAYKRLNIMAMARVKKGGFLFTFSCSQVVDKPLFHNTIVAAAIESGRLARVMHELSQGPDHPVSIFHPEGHYLKGLALCLE